MPDLVPVTKTVKRATGKTHEQIYWVKASDIREAKTLKEKLALVGGTERAEQMIDGWTDSSTERGAVQMRAGVVRNAVNAGGMTPEEVAEEREDVRQFGGDEAVATFDQAMGSGSGRSAQEMSAMARVTAAYHEEPELTAYRGIGAEQTAQIRAQFEAGATEVTIDVGVLSSFSESRDVAMGFARQDRAGGAVVIQRLPPTAIVLSHRVPGTRLMPSEQELVVYSRGSITVRREDVQFRGAMRSSAFEGGPATGPERGS